MSWYYNDFEYESAASRKARLSKEIAKRLKRGETFTSFEAPAGTKIVKNFWGLAWCRHLENYCGYENRLPRGRTYLRQGNVYNLKVEKGHITAEVTGSEIYEIEITIQPLPTEKWSKIRSQCAGQVASLLDLLSGKLGDGVMKIVADPETGLFPSRREIKHFCSCPDSADLCKHRAAVLYAVGVLFDRDPKFLFELRGTDPSELIASSVAALTQGDSSANAAGTEALADEDLSSLFGIDLAEDVMFEPAASATAFVSPEPASPPMEEPVLLSPAWSVPVEIKMLSVKGKTKTKVKAKTGTSTKPEVKVKATNKAAAPKAPLPKKVSTSKKRPK